MITSGPRRKMAALVVSIRFQDGADLSPFLRLSSSSVGYVSRPPMGRILRQSSSAPLRRRLILGDGGCLVS